MAAHQPGFSEQVGRVARQMNEVSRHYEQLFTDFGIRVFQDIDGLDNASQIMAVCRRHIDEALAAFETHFPDGSDIACAKGCHHCCFFPIECPPQVSIDIADHVMNTFSDSACHELIQKLVRDVEMRQPPFNRFPCPFLGPEHFCSIYDKRPLSCRWFTSPDAALCEKSLKDNSQIPQHTIRQRIFQAATTMLLAHEKKRGRQPVQVAFVPALLENLNKLK